MATIENSAHPEALAHAAKYGAFLWCADVNLNDIDDARIEMLERRLLAENGYLS